MKRIVRDLGRFTTPSMSSTPRLHSMLLVGAGGSVTPRGAGVTALAASAAAEASVNGKSDFVRFITALDILTAEGGGGDEARAAALVERFSEAREMQSSLLVLDDVDQMTAGSGPRGYSSVMLSTLRALIRTPPPGSEAAKPGGQSKSSNVSGKTLHILATSSRSDAACAVLNEIFEETIVVPLLCDAESVETLLSDCLPEKVADVSSMSQAIVSRLGKVGCKSALRLAERAVFGAGMQGTSPDGMAARQLFEIESILNDFAGDEAIAAKECEVI
jgi:hypothetical protein